MKTPKKTPIEIEIVNEIRSRLLKRKGSKKWLAHMLDMEYGKVKRILSNTNSQQLSISVADQMLVLLGSSIREVVSQPLVEALSADVVNCLSKYHDR